MAQQDLTLLKANPRVYGVKGPLIVETPDFRSAVSQAFLAAAKEQGFAVRDTNDGDANGFSNVQVTVDQGKRVSSATAFLRPDVLKRPNLDVVLNAQVTKGEKYRLFF